jgi:CHAT domain-containing protein
MMVNQRAWIALTFWIFCVWAGFSPPSSTAEIQPVGVLQTVQFTAQADSSNTEKKRDLDRADELAGESLNLQKKGRNAEALDLVKRALALRKKHLPADHKLIGESLYNIGYLSFTLGHYDQAESNFIKALEVFKKALGPKHYYTGMTQKQLGGTYRKKEEYAKAEAAYKESIVIMEKAKGRDSIQTAYSVGSLGLTYYKQKKYEQALVMYQRELAIKEKVKGRNNPETARTLMNAANCYNKLNQYDLAEKHHQDSLAAYEKSSGPNHQDTLDQLDNLAFFYYQQKQYDKALPQYERLVESLKKSKTAKTRKLLASIKKLGDTHHHLEDLKETEKWYLEVLSQARKVQSEHAEIVVYTMADLGLVYKKQNEFAKAKTQYQNALDLAGKTYGRDSSVYAERLMSLGRLFYEQKQYDPALEYYEKASAVLEKDPKATVTNRSFALHSIGYLSRLTLQHRKSLEYYQKAYDLRKKTLGPGHEDTIDTLGGMAEAYMNLGNFPKGEKTYLQALELCRTHLTPENSTTLNIMTKVGLLWAATFRFEKAEPLLTQVLATRTKALGPNHALVADSHLNLARLYESRGDITASAEHLQKGIGILEKTAPRDGRLVPNYRLWAKVLTYQGDYDRAAKVLQKSLDLAIALFGERSAATSECLVSLGEFRKSMGNNKEAADLFEKVLEIKREIYGAKAFQTAKAMQFLAMVQDPMSPRKIELLSGALEIYEKSIGRDNPALLSTLSHLAETHNKQGNKKQAEKYLKRAIATGEKMGPDSPLIMGVHALLATIYLDNGEYDKAEKSLKKIRPFLEKALGKSSPSNAHMLGALGIIDAAKGRYEASHGNLLKALGIQDQYIDQVMGFESEERKLSYLIQMNKGLNYFLSNMVLHLNKDQNAVRAGLDVWLRRKGIILDAQQRFQEALVYGENEKAVQTFQELASVRAQISKLVFSQEYQQEPERMQKRLDDLNARKKVLESELSRLSRAYALDKKKSKADARQVATTLPAGSALIEFARIKVADFKKGKDTWLPDRYLVFIIHAAPNDTVRMIDLGEAEKIDQAIQQFKKAVTNLDDLEGHEAAAQGLILYNIVFSPIEKELGGVRTIFVAPDGNLNLIPFEVLNTPDGRYLIDDYTFNYLSSGRDLLGVSSRKSTTGKALLLGDPDFDLGTKQKTSELRKLKLKLPIEKQPNQRSVDCRGLNFTPLDGTRDEVKAIGKILGNQRTRSYLGSQALEEILFRTDSPSILHLATHGFFLNNVDFNAVMGRPGIMPEDAPDLKVENPLLRSGLALAGANQAFKVSSQGYYDGLLTAEKILGLKLRNTNLVVLSACETGLGEVKNGEGVYGLRRAFSQAGAKGIVMSMWSVPDEETKELMVNFYKNIAAGKIPPSQALRQAALKQKQICQERYGHTNPLFWGAFVYLGEP